MPLDSERIVHYYIHVNNKPYLLLEYLRQRKSLTGKNPSFSEMAKQMEVNSKQTIEDWLSILEKEGYIERSGYPQRKINLTEKGQGPKETTRFTSELPMTSVSNIQTENTNYGSTSSIDQFDPLINGDIKLKVNNINLYMMKGGEKNGTK